MDEELIRHLNRLRQLFDKYRNYYYSEMVDLLLSKGKESTRSFLVSDGLWGEFGSIAVDWGSESREKAREKEAILADLGERQLCLGIVNEQTAHWTYTFRYWQRIGI